MANDIDNAIARLQAIALQCSSVAIKAAPDYPVEDAMVFPIAIAYNPTGTFSPDNASTARILPTANVDFHFSRISLKNAYTQSNLITEEYARRLCGDPSLNGTISTIVFPVNFTCGPSQWDKVTTHLLRFVIPLKIITTPTAST